MILQNVWNKNIFCTFLKANAILHNFGKISLNITNCKHFMFFPADTYKLLPLPKEFYAFYLWLETYLSMRSNTILKLCLCLLFRDSEPESWRRWSCFCSWRCWSWGWCGWPQRSWTRMRRAGSLCTVRSRLEPASPEPCSPLTFKALK